MTPRKRPDSERFDEKVDKNAPGGCWVWLGKRAREGYGRFWLPSEQRFTPAHRWNYERSYGPIPTGMLACHHCDNPPCVNPSHLFIGTTQDNTRDKIAKGRGNTSGLRQFNPRQDRPPGYVDPRTKERCVRGHLLSETGVRQTGSNGRCCGECRRLRKRKPIPA